MIFPMTIMELSETEKKWLGKRTKLNKKQLSSLLEEKNDRNLILQSISKSNITKRELKNLSFSSICRIFLFQTLNEVQTNSRFSIETISFIGDCLDSFFIDINKSKSLILLTEDDMEKDFKNCGYFLILLGCFSYRVPEETVFALEDYRRVVKKYFYLKNQEIERNLDYWLDVLGKVAEKIRKR